MALDLTDEQVLLREAIAHFTEKEMNVSRSRALHDDPLGYDPKWIQSAANLGWFAMLVSESNGGGSISTRPIEDASLIAEEVGRNVQPGPFVPMNIVAGALSIHGSEAQRATFLPQIVSGETVASWAFSDRHGRFDLGVGVRGKESTDGVVLNGSRGFVQYGASAHLLLVVAMIDEEPVELLVRADEPGIGFIPLSPLDLSRRIAHVELTDVRIGPEAVLVRGPEAIEAQLRVAMVLNCVETVGALDSLFGMTLDYAMDRTAFGRPIGSFQALKHVLADQLLYLETCKAAATAAMHAVTADDAAAPEIVSMAAAYIADVSNDVAQECLQIHGGIGYTWEHNLHLYLRRIRSNAALFGEASWHRERVCQFHRLGDPEMQ